MFSQPPKITLKSHRTYFEQTWRIRKWSFAIRSSSWLKWILETACLTSVFITFGVTHVSMRHGSHLTPWSTNCPSLHMYTGCYLPKAFLFFELLLSALKIMIYSILNMVGLILLRFLIVLHIFNHCFSWHHTLLYVVTTIPCVNRLALKSFLYIFLIICFLHLTLVNSLSSSITKGLGYSDQLMGNLKLLYVPWII